MRVNTGYFTMWFFTEVRADPSALISQHRALFARSGCLESVSSGGGRGCHKLSLVERAENVTAMRWGMLIIPSVCLKGIHSASHTPEKKRYFLSSDV